MLKTLHLFAALAGIALVSGLVLGSLHEATAKLAASNILRFKKVPALVVIHESMRDGSKLNDDERAALEEQLLSSSRLVDVKGEEPLTVYMLGKEGQSNTVALEAFGQGFGGKLGVMVGIELASGDLAGVGITTMSETPGLGSRVHEPAFTQQFAGMSGDASLKLKKDGGELDAVTGATISSRAVVEAVGQAKKLYNTHKAAIEAAIQKKP